MRTLYLDCGMGAAGDMLTAALLELLPDRDGFLEEMNNLGIPGVAVSCAPSVKCGIAGTHVTVTVDGAEEGEEHHVHHHHSHIADIEALIRERLNLPEQVKADVLSVFNLLAEAESRVHGVPVTDIHLHEVGTMDALADITAVCMLMRRIAPDEVVASPVHTGYGHVRCAHGILPVPAPATAHLLQGIPACGGDIEGELCTPTGAALLKYFVTRFGPMPVMRTEAIGYGMGRKDFPAANCVRAMLGERDGNTDTVTELSCNVDDMTAEAVAYAVEKLFAGGALDVYTVPVGMKKGRPGTLIRVLCRRSDTDAVVRLIFRHTTTIGIRKAELDRFVLERRIEAVDTPYGTVRRKISAGCGVERVKYEYDDLAKLAEARGITLAEAQALAEDFT